MIYGTPDGSLFVLAATGSGAHKRASLACFGKKRHYRCPEGHEDLLPLTRQDYETLRTVLL